MTLSPYQRAEAFELAFPDAAEHGARFTRGRAADGQETIYAVWSCGQDYRNKSRMYGAFPHGFMEKTLSLFPDARRILWLFSGSLTKEQVEEAWGDKDTYCSVCWRRGPKRVLGYTHFSTVDQMAPCHGGNPHAWAEKAIALQLRFDSATHPIAKAAQPDVVGDAEDLAKALLMRDLIATEYRGKAPPTVGGDRIVPGPSRLATPTKHTIPFDLIIADPPYAKSDQRRYFRESGLENCKHCGKLRGDHPWGLVRPTPELTAKRVRRWCWAAGEGSEGGPYEPKQRFRTLNKKCVLAECARVLAPGGWLVWVDTSPPLWSKRNWIYRGGFALLRSTNHRVRWASFLERVK